MKNWHTEKISIDDTSVDYSLQVPLTELMKLFQVATFKHSQIMDLDHESMKQKSNAFWVVTKMKAILKSPILSGAQIKVTTWTHELSSARALRDCVIKKGNTIKAKLTAEWCCLDYDTRKLRRMSTIDYPKLEMEKTENIKTDFTNLREVVDENDYVYTRVVRSTDIDVNNHTNNLKYNFMAMDAFSVEELKSMKVKEYEIYFVNESHEGDKIDVSKKKIKNYVYVEGKSLDKTIFKAVFKI